MILGRGSDIRGRQSRSDAAHRVSIRVTERALRGLALGRKSWLFAGSKRGAERAALMVTLSETCKLCLVDPQAYLADVLNRIVNGRLAHDIDELLPWAYAEAPPLKDVA